jgi:hypothetical protein
MLAMVQTHYAVLCTSTCDMILLCDVATFKKLAFLFPRTPVQKGMTPLITAML